MSIKPRNGAGDGLASLARRDLLKVALGTAALSLTNLGFAAAGETHLQASGAELFAFRAPVADTLVFAVAFPSTDEFASCGEITSARIHAGPRSFTVGWGAGKSPCITSGDAPAELFVGRVSKPTALGGQPHNLLALSASAKTFPLGALSVWAEVTARDNAKSRIGSPIVAELVARDPSLAPLFQAAHSIEDRPRSLAELAERISARSSAAGRVDARTHGERLAGTLIPDVLSFDPRRPVGFTFAGRNGRRPSDAVADIVHTVLTGVATPRESARTAFGLSNSFPYFLSAVA
jgi:hypothetical protein